jgi:hypothetical protein
MAKLSSIPFYDKQILMLAKFSNTKAHLESLQKGDLFMNRLGLYKDIEKQTGIAGVGDKHDGHIVITNIQTVTLYDQETGEEMGTGSASSISFASNDVLAMPTFCSLGIDPDMLEIVDEDENKYIVEILFDPEKLTRIIEVFGEHMLLIEYGEFVKELRKASEKEKFDFVGKKIKYADYTVNQLDRVKHPDLVDVAFWKSIDFSYQHEHRFVINTYGIETPYIIQLGDLSELSYLLSASDLNEKHIQFSVSKPHLY